MFVRGNDLQLYNCQVFNCNRSYLFCPAKAEPVKFLASETSTTATCVISAGFYLGGGEGSSPKCRRIEVEPDSMIPRNLLVQLLEHLNIITSAPPALSPTGIKNPYLMPCLL